MLGQGRGRIPLYTNDYVGVLRRKVAAKMATNAPHVRLLFSGVPSVNSGIFVDIQDCVQDADTHFAFC